jgi:hypothetical protein
VYESITVQSLPPDYQRAAMHCIADFVAPGGEALIMTWSQPPTRLQDGPPWLLPRDALKAYEEAGLEQLDYQEELIRTSPQIWHIQAQYRRL